MEKAEVRCPVCGTSFVVGKGGNTVTELTDGVHYLVPETVRNENVTSANAEVRMTALEAAGIKVGKLQSLMQSNGDLKEIFASDDPIIAEISKGGFIDNPELFRRWICAQTFRLIKDKSGWTAAVRKTYDTKYVYNQSKRELVLLCKLVKKCPNDIRLRFFTLEDLQTIFCELMDHNEWYCYRNDEEKKKKLKMAIKSTRTYINLYDIVHSINWRFRYDCTFKPKAWLNCFKGAGAYYTLQNVIRTHGLILPECNNMEESLEVVDKLFNTITSYKPNERRWDIMLSVLTRAVDERNFELKF